MESRFSGFRGNYRKTAPEASLRNEKFGPRTTAHPVCTEIDPMILPTGVAESKLVKWEKNAKVSLKLTSGLHVEGQCIGVF
jgi:hypothetical protein